MMLRVALSLLLISASAISAAPLRFARAGELDGTTEIQLHAAESWRAAIRNTPLPQGARLRTAASSRFEAEMDDGTVLRLAGESLAEIADLTQLSTGQKITLFSLDHGTFYFTARPQSRDSLSVALPGAQITLRQRARVRFEISDSFTQVAVLEGVVRFSTPTAEMDLREGHLARIDSGRAGRFELLREVPQLESDDWSQKRDAAQEKSASTGHLPRINFGAADLDLAGSWLQTDDAGIVWKPKVADSWAPFQSGTWRWFDELGYTWIATETWGWVPYHYGRWLQNASLGWVWAPGSSNIFKPGEVFWMRAAGLALWGPLAPDEFWTGVGPARQFAALNTTAAKFELGQRELDPSVPFVRPKELLTAAQFTLALPSPPLVGSRFDAVNPPLKSTGVGTISLSAPEFSIPGASYEARPVTVPPATIALPPPRPATTIVIDRPVYVDVPEPFEIYYPVPYYTGIIVLNPAPAKPPKTDRNTPGKKHGKPPETPEPATPDKSTGS